MKKFLSILLAAALLAAVCAVPVCAETVVGGNDGVTTFDPTTSKGQDLNIQVSDVTHKYAVDVTYNLSALTFGGDITWNVTTMKYDVNAADLKNTTRTIEVSNRSDLPVYAFATVTSENADDGITIAADHSSTNNKLEIAKATAGIGENGTATAANLTLNITSADWNAVAEYYAQKKLAENASSFKIATVTVTISKD